MQQSSTTKRILDPNQANLISPLFNAATEGVQDPAKSLEPQRVLARNQVNQDYSGAFDRLRSAFFGSTNPGASGKSGMAAVATDVARRSKLADVDMSFAAQAPQQRLNWAQLAAQLLGINFGQQTDSSGTSSSSGFGFSVGGGIGGR